MDADDVTLFDIAVVDEMGREVALSGQVRVSVAEPDPNADFIGPMPEKSQEASAAGEVSPAPEVFHFSGAEPGASVESVDVQESDEGFSFTTASFSPFAFVYTVDFEYEGYTYNLEGGGETLLSQLIGSLNLDFAASDVVAVTLSNQELLAAEPVRDEHDHIADWKLTSLRPFATTEVLTITLKTGEIVSVVVTDAQHITELSRIIEAATLSVDGVDIPWPALVREGKYYDLRLEFKENEIYQFIDDDTAMTYTLPEGIYIGDEDFERTFTMDVGDGVRLEQEVDTSHEWAPNGSDEDYIYWKITFKRQPYKLTRCVIEDNNPTLYGKREEVDVGNKEAQDFSEIHAYDYRITGTDEFNLSDPDEECDILWVDGLYPAEGWQISAATNTRTTIRFYQDKESVKPGLVQRDPQKTDEENTITIYLRTKNNEDWIKGTMTQYWPRDHTNSVTWIPNAHQVDAEATATPDIRKIEKVGKQVGTVSDPATGVMLPVFRYEIYVTGLSPDDFDASGNFEITDSFNTNFLKFVEVTNYNSPYPGSADLVSHKFTMTSDDQTELGVTWWDETFKGFSKSNKWVGPVKVTVSDFGSGGKDGVRFVVKKSDFEDTTRRNGLEPGSDSEYCMRYSLPYYLVVKDANAAQKLAQLAEGQYTEGEFAGITKTADGKVLFGNTATWGSASLESTVDADADFSPMSKTVSYDSNTDTCTYTIIINPQRLRLNDGEIVCVRDTYTNLAVDFLSVAEGISTVPPENKNLVDWSYHNNAGTFFVPDETMVTITYRAQPIGDPGKSMTFSNEVSMLNFEPKSITKTVKLNSESEGSAGDYNVRVFKYADNSMNVPLRGAVFQLYEQGPDGLVPLEYKTDQDSATPRYDDERYDDHEILRDINLGEKNPGVATNRDGTVATQYPSREHHREGDYIYFATTSYGYADIHLDQSLDGYALVRGKQYYLMEVVTPEGYTKEDHPWSFIVDDMDFFDTANGVWVYRDNGVMTIANTSQDAGLVLRKDFAGDIPPYSVRKDVSFQIAIREEGSEDTLYKRTITYEDFARDYAVPEGFRFKIRPEELTARGIDDAKNYVVTVTEGNADVETHTRQTSATTQVGEGEVTTATGSQANAGTFAASVTVPGAHLRDGTPVRFRFANIYTARPVGLTVSKAWGEKASQKVNESVEYELSRYGLKDGSDTEFDTVAIPVGLNGATYQPSAGATPGTIALNDGNGWR